MAETDLHRDMACRLIELLKNHFAGHRTYVSGDLKVCYDEEDLDKWVVPDCFIVKDVDPEIRRDYRIWVEGKPPDVIIEITSSSTQREDLGWKMRLYAQLGVKEYFLYDPLGEYLHPPVLGLVLSGGGYIPLDREDRVESQELGLVLAAEEGGLQLYDVASGTRLLTAEERAAVEVAARQAAEAELARLRDELAHPRKG